MTVPDWLLYQHLVVEGDQPAGELIHLAVQRSLADHERFADEGEWVFMPEFAGPVIRFLHRCPHVKGRQARERKLLLLELWQRWLVWESYGWRRREDPMERRFREVLVEVARKNGKTSFAAGLSLYELRYGDVGAEVYAAATKRDQSAIVWEIAGQMILRMPPRLRGDMKKTVHDISCEKGGRVFKPLARNAHTLDGLNPSFAVIDEAASIEDRAVIEALDTALGAREMAWILYITTAQSTHSTVYREKRDAAEAALRGSLEMDRTFAALYALDPPADPEKPETGDDPEDEETWVHANPNIGVSVMRSELRRKVSDSATNATARRTVKLKHFNLWGGHVAAWIESPRAWVGAVVPELKRSGQCFIGLDLAQTRNLAAVCRLWVVGRGRFHADFQCWMPERTLGTISKLYRARYEEAVERGVLKLTGGPVTDIDEIDGYLRDSYDQYMVEMIGCDPYNAHTLVNRLEEDLFPILTVRQSIAYMSSPAKLVESLIEAGRIGHDGDPFVGWQLTNCVAYRDVNHNLKVRRSDSEPDRQIDAITALIIAAACTDGMAEVEDRTGFSFVPFGGGGGGARGASPNDRGGSGPGLGPRTIY